MKSDWPTPVDCSPTLDSVFEALGTASNRQILGLLLVRPYERLYESDLALDLAARRYDKPLSEVTSDEQYEQATALQYNNLPRLDDYGLIVRDEDEQAVMLTDHPAYEDSGIRDLLLTENGPEDDVSTVCTALAHKRRRSILAVLGRQHTPISPITLAELVTSLELDTPQDHLRFSDLEQRYLSLFHMHLPRLHDAELIERTSQGVTYQGHPLIQTQWLYERFNPSVFTSSMPKSSP